MSKKILVTGATGTVGSQVIQSLASYPVQVRAGSYRRPLSTSPSWHSVEAIPFAFELPTTYAKALEKIDSIFLLPPAEGVGQALVHPFLDYLMEYSNHVNHIVVLSAMGITPGDGTPYGAIEEHLKTTGLPYTILRANWFMQNFSTYYAAAIRQHRLFALPASDAYTSFVDARDIGAVAAKIMALEIHRGEALTLTGWESLSYAQTAEILTQTLGVTITYQPLRDDAMRRALEQQGWPVERIEAMLDLFQRVRNGHNAALSQDVASVLGRPPLTFAQYAADYSSTWKTGS